MKIHFQMFTTLLSGGFHYCESKHAMHFVQEKSLLHLTWGNNTCHLAKIGIYQKHTHYMVCVNNLLQVGPSDKLLRHIKPGFSV